MRLDEAVRMFLDGKAVECDPPPNTWHTILVFEKEKHGLAMNDAERGACRVWPIDGWRLKREVLNPMQAWSRMKAGKVVRSDACRREFRCLAGLEVKVVGGSGFIPAYDSMDKFMSATDLYEVEDE